MLDAIERSLEGGNVLELYTFTFGAVVTRYTSFNSDIVFAGVAYTHTQISRSQIEATSEQAANQVKVTVPLDNAVASKFIASVPGQVGSVQIHRAHADDPAEERLLIFDGFIAQVDFDGDIQAVMTCKPETDVVSLPGPRYTYQGLCSHILYDGRCKVMRTGDPAGEFTFTGAVTATAGRTITVAGISANGADWAVGGFVKTPTGGSEDARLVLEQSGDVLTLLLPFSVAVQGTDVDVFAGCKHDLLDCENKFNNVINYGGFPFVPRNNPFNTSLRGGS